MQISGWLQRQLALVLSTVLIVLLAACGANPGVIGSNAVTKTPTGSNTASPPTISSVSVSPAPAGDTFTMTINGSNFTTDATTTLGATPLATTYVSPVQLTAAVPATLVAIVSTASVQVSTPNGTSSPRFPVGGRSVAHSHQPEPVNSGRRWRGVYADD